MSFNKTAIITGSNKGIGRAILDLFSNNYEIIWACSRKEDSNFIDFCKNISKEKNIIVKNVFFFFFYKILEAQLIIKAFKESKEAVISFDGKMIDKPLVEAKERVLLMAGLNPKNRR